ncbi:hypothetical protein D3C73_1494950 [compost metagenome]
MLLGGGLGNVQPHPVMIAGTSALVPSIELGGGFFQIGWREAVPRIRDREMDSSVIAPD